MFIPDWWVPDAIVLGKGPSAANREVVFKKYPEAVLVTLNHAIRWADTRKEVWAHFVDLEALHESWSSVLLHAKSLLVPSVMNEKSHRSKTKLVTSFPTIVYDRDVVGLRFFSVEGAVGALGSLGRKKVVLCGVDGGTGYAPGLEDVADRERAGSGHANYDAQWAQLDRISERFGMEVFRAD